MDASRHLDDPAKALCEDSPLSTVRPLYLGTGRNQAAALFSPSGDGASDRTAVVICSPWGWDEVASYRSRRRWAERLAAAGHATLRFDLPAWGDSAGSVTDEDLLGAWVDAVDAAAAWVRAEAGAPRVALLGLGLGGLLARAALARGAGAGAEELILWGAPRNGKAFVREARAFAALQGWAGDGTAESAYGAGALEAGGFVLSGETRAALTALDPAPVSGTALRRALLLARDGGSGEPELATALEAAGVEVATGPGNGWGELIVHPEQTRLSAETAAAVERWLAAGSGSGPKAAPAAATTSLSMRVGEAEIRETPMLVDLDFGSAYGVLAEPVGGRRGDTCAVFLNAGAVRHMGPNRLWTEATRASAALGVPAMRVDLEGIGEADGDEVRLREVGEFFDGRYAEQALGLLENLSRAGIAEQFVLIGLCSGAYWSFRAALGSRRVRRVLMLNSGALVWRPSLYTDRAIRDLSRLRDRAWWRGLVTGKHSRKGAREALRVLWRKLGSLAGGLLGKLRRSGRAEAALTADLDRLERQGTHLTVAFSAGEMLLGELEADGTMELLGRRHGIQLEELPGDDHTLRPVGTQAAAHELIAREILATQEEMPGPPQQSDSAPA